MQCATRCTATNGFQGEGFFPRCPECGGYHRDLTPAFQGLVMEACAAVIPSAENLKRSYCIKNTAAAWALEPTSQTARMDIPGRGALRAGYHAVGNWDSATGQFDWAWQGDDKVSKPAEHARRVGAHYWLRALTAPQIFVGETEAWHLAMVTAYLSDLPAVAAEGQAFVVLETPVWEN